MMIGSDRRLNPETYFQKTFFSTNEVVMHVDDSGQLTYYLPCYVRFLVKEIDQVNAAEMEAFLSGTLLFSFYYGSIDREIIEEFVGQEKKKKAILLEFNHQDSILLKEGKGITMKEDEKEKIVTFVIRQRFGTHLKGNVFLTPFETLDMYMSVTVQSIHLPPRNRQGPKIRIKFNCMDSSEVDVLGHGEDLSFGNYRIASYFMEARYTQSRKNPFKPIAYIGNNEQDDENQERSTKSMKSTIDPDEGSIQCFQYAHFRVPIYKFPGIPLLTIFIPIQILGVIGLFVFFQEPGLSARLATIAVLILAFVAFLPTINDSIPQTPKVKLVDILIFMHLTAILILAVESYLVRDEEAATFKFDWTQSSLFIASLILNATTFLTLFVLFIVHKCFWERKYRKIKVDTSRKYKKLVRKSWRNRECDNLFSSLAANSKVKNI